MRKDVYDEEPRNLVYTEEQQRRWFEKISAKYPSLTWERFCTVLNNRALKIIEETEKSIKKMRRR